MKANKAQKKSERDSPSSKNTTRQDGKETEETGPPPASIKTKDGNVDIDSIHIGSTSVSATSDDITSSSPNSAIPCQRWRLFHWCSVCKRVHLTGAPEEVKAVGRHSSCTVHVRIPPWLSGLVRMAQNIDDGDQNTFCLGIDAVLPSPVTESYTMGISSTSTDLPFFLDVEMECIRAIDCPRAFVARS